MLQFPPWGKNKGGKLPNNGNSLVIAFSSCLGGKTKGVNYQTGKRYFILSFYFKHSGYFHHTGHFCSKAFPVFFLDNIFSDKV